MTGIVARHAAAPSRRPVATPRAPRDVRPAAAAIGHPRPAQTPPAAPAARQSIGLSRRGQHETPGRRRPATGSRASRGCRSWVAACVASIITIVTTLLSVVSAFKRTLGTNRLIFHVRFIRVAVQPPLTRFRGRDHRVAARAGMFARMLVGRRVAATRRPALLTGSQVNPVRTDRDALLAGVRLRRLDGFDLCDVQTRRSHRLHPLWPCTSPPCGPEPVVEVDAPALPPRDPRQRIPQRIAARGHPLPFAECRPVSWARSRVEVTQSVLELAHGRGGCTDFPRARGSLMRSFCFKVLDVRSRRIGCTTRAVVCTWSARNAAGETPGWDVHMP